MKLYLSVLICIFQFSLITLRAQDENYDAVYEKLIKEYTLNADGSMDYRYIKQLKLQTYRAFQSLYGETFVVYDTAYQKLKINEVYTVMADGKKVAAPQNSFNLTLPGFAANAPAYASLREMVITHTGLERNATINLDYQLHSRNGALPFLMGNEILAESEPVKNLEVRVRIPVGTKLNYHLVNTDLEPVVTTGKDFEVYSWKFSAVAAISAEEGQQEGYTAYPRLLFSSSDNISDAYAFLTGQPAFWFALPESCKSEVSRLTNLERDRFKLALKIQEKVVSDIRLYPVPFRTAMYRMRPAEKSWNSNGATPAEKAVLLTAMLREAGFDARLTVIVRTALYDEKIATLGNIEDFAVWVDMKEKGEWYLSVTSLNPVNLKTTLSNRSFIIFGPDGKTMVRRSEIAANQVKVTGNFIVSSDPKLTGEISLYVNGSAFPGAGLPTDRNKMRDAISGNLIKNDTNNLKKSVINNDNGFQTFIVQSDKPFKKDSDFYFFQLPCINTGVESWNMHTLSEKRATAYEIPTISDESYTYTIVLPSMLSLFTPEKKLTISNKAGTYSWELKSDNGKVMIRRSIKFSDQVVPVTIYPDFKALMDAWNNPWYKQVIFRKG